MKKENGVSLSNTILTEKIHQQTLFEWASYHWWAPYFVHVPNELPTLDKNKQNFYKILAVRKSMGVRKGFPDNFLYVPIDKYHGFAQEIKRKGEIPTDPQYEYLDRLKATGYYVCWSDTPEQSIQQVKDYLGKWLYTPLRLNDVVL